MTSAQRSTIVGVGDVWVLLVITQRRGEAGDTVTMTILSREKGVDLGLGLKIF